MVLASIWKFGSTWVNGILQSS